MPQIGRFMSRDSYGGEMMNPLSMNLYTYVQNNPLNFIDPTGHKAKKNSKVETLQKLMNNNGFSPGSVDGIWGPKTAHAYQHFYWDGNRSSLSNSDIKYINALYKPYSAHQWKDHPPMPYHDWEGNASTPHDDTTNVLTNKPKGRGQQQNTGTQQQNQQQNQGTGENNNTSTTIQSSISNTQALKNSWNDLTKIPQTVSSGFQQSWNDPDIRQGTKNSVISVIARTPAGPVRSAYNYANKLAPEIVPELKLIKADQATEDALSISSLVKIGSPSTAVKVDNWIDRVKNFFK